MSIAPARSRRSGPFIRGTAQNPDVYFQARESVNTYYDRLPGIVQETMDALRGAHRPQLPPVRLRRRAGCRARHHLMGSGAETAEETARHLQDRGEKVGVLKVRLFRPFAVDAFLAALPPSVRSIAVLDRTKEPGAAGEPLFQDVVTAISQAVGAATAPFEAMPQIIGGRYGLSSKEFTPAMVDAVFAELDAAAPKPRFTVGIDDDVTHLSLAVDRDLDIEPSTVKRAVFWGLGSDGTVGANKNSIKIIGEETDLFAQGYFVYDSKKSGARHGQPPALRARADPLHLPDRQGRLRGRPPVRLLRTHRRPGERGPRRHAAHQLAARARGHLGAPSAGGATRHPRAGSSTCT